MYMCFVVFMLWCVAACFRITSIILYSQYSEPYFFPLSPAQINGDPIFHALPWHRCPQIHTEFRLFHSLDFRHGPVSHMYECWYYVFVSVPAPIPRFPDSPDFISPILCLDSTAAARSKKAAEATVVKKRMPGTKTRAAEADMAAVEGDTGAPCHS
jgi:hypothetical protein